MLHFKNQRWNLFRKAGIGTTLLLLAAAIIWQETSLVAKDIEIANTEIWKTLSRVTWKQRKDEKSGYPVDVPVFSPEIIALNGQEIRVTGYMVPLTVHNVGTDFLVLSAYPVRSCFFCGGAGPETVMEVYPKNGDKNYLMERISFTGRLELNADDPEHLIYLLKNAEISFTLD